MKTRIKQLAVLGGLVWLALATPALAGVNTYTLTVTNFPLTGSNITANGTTRVFTNATTAGTILTNLTTLSGVTTNIANAYGGFPQLGVTVSWLTSTQLVFRGTDLTLSAGVWCTIVTNLSASTNLHALMLPHFNLQGASAAVERTNDANAVAEYLQYVTTNALPQTAVFGANYVSLSQTQTVGNKVLTNSTAQNWASFTNIDAQRINLKPFGTNYTNFGAVLFYDRLTNAVASIRPGTNGLPGLYDAAGGLLWNDDFLSVNVFDATNAAALLNVGSAVEKFPLLATATSLNRYSNTVSIPNYWTSPSNVFAAAPKFNAGFEASAGTNRGGYLSNTVSHLFTGSNNVFQGSNEWGGDLSVPYTVVDTLANGTNILDSYTNWAIRIRGTITADSYLAGWKGGREGKEFEAINDTAYTLTILHESGLAPIATERFACLGQSNAVVSAGGSFWVRYYGNRWTVRNVYPLGGVAGGTGEANTLGSAGLTNSTRAGLYGAKVGVALSVVTLSEGTGISLTRQGDVSGNTTNVVLATTTGVGEANTLSSLGTGWALPTTKSGVDLRVNSVTNDSSLSSSSNANTITFSRSALTGAITAGAGANATFLAADIVQNTNLANMAVNTLKGRATAGTGDPEDLTLSPGFGFNSGALMVTNVYEFSFGETNVLTTGTAKITWRAPFAFTVRDLRASLGVVSSSGIPTVDINEGGTTIISTKLTIDAGEKTSTTAAAAHVISDASIADDAEITFDIDVAGTDAAGLKVKIYYTR